MDFEKISYSEVENLANKLKTAGTDMEAILSEIKMLLSKIGDDGTWSGEAAVEAKATFDEISVKFPEFSQSVIDCGSYLINTVIANAKIADGIVRKTGGVQEHI